MSLSCANPRCATAAVSVSPTAKGVTAQPARPRHVLTAAVPHNIDTQALANGDAYVSIWEL